MAPLTRRTTVIALLIPALIQFLPGIIFSIESLSSHKKSVTGEPMPGPDKLNAVTTLAMTALQLANIVDPKHIGQAEAELAQDVANAIVTYNNKRNIFTHGPAVIPVLVAPAVVVP